MVVKTKNPEATAAHTTVAAKRWPHLLNELTNTVIDPHLARPETRTPTCEVIGALLAPLTTKNCWSLAQQAGHGRPYRIQHLLSQADMDEEPLAAALRGYLISHLGTSDVVLVSGETGDIKKGTHTVGVARQSPQPLRGREVPPRRHGPGRELPGRGLSGLHHTRAHALIDHRLYLPVSWTDDEARLRGAGVPEDVEFTTKPELAR